MKAKTKSINFSLFAILISGLLAILGGINQFIGYFGKIGIPTVIISLISGVLVLLYFPYLIKEKQKSSHKYYSLIPVRISVLVGISVILIGTLPFLWNFFQATRYAKLGTESLITGSAVKSNLYWNMAFKLYENLGFEKRALNAKILIAQSQSLLGNSEKAKALLATIETSELNEELQAKILIVKASLAKSSGNLPLAEINFQRSLELVKKGSIENATILLNYSLVLASRGPSFNGEVIKMTEDAESIFRKNNYEKGVDVALLDLATFNEYEPQKARNYLSQATELAQKENYVDIQGIADLNMGLLEKKMGKLDSAMIYYNNASKEFTSISDVSGQAELENQIAYLEIARSNYAAAMQRVKQSKAYIKILTDTPEDLNKLQLAKLLRTQAGILDALGDIENAEIQYAEALKIYEECPDEMEEINTRINYAAFYLGLHQTAKANDIINPIVQLFETDFKGVKHQYLAVAYNNIGTIFMNNGDLENAKKYIDKALSISTDIGDKFLEAQAQQNVIIINSLLGVKDSTEAATKNIPVQSNTNISEDLISILNSYLQNGASMSQQQLYDTTNYLLKKINEPQVSVKAKNEVILGLQVQDIDMKNLSRLRTGLQTLLTSIKESQSPSDVGRANLSLALIELRLGNYKDATQFSTIAGKHYSDIVYPKSILYCKKLAYISFVENNYNEGTNWLFKCIDQSLDKPENIQYNEVSGDLNVISSCWSKITTENAKSYVQKVETIKANCKSDRLISVYDKFLSGK